MPRILFDDVLDKEVLDIMKAWKKAGLRNVSKPDVIRTLLYKYREDAYTVPQRLPHSKKVRIK